MKTPNFDKMVSGIKSLATPLQDLILHEAMTDKEYAEKAAASLLALQAENVRTKSELHTWLERLEWAASDEWDNMCPVCGCYKHMMKNLEIAQHADDCELAKALKG